MVVTKVVEALALVAGMNWLTVGSVPVARTLASRTATSVVVLGLGAPVANWWGRGQYATTHDGNLTHSGTALIFASYGTRLCAWTNAAKSQRVLALDGCLLGVLGAVVRDATRNWRHNDIHDGSPSLGTA